MTNPTPQEGAPPYWALLDEFAHTHVQLTTLARSYLRHGLKDIGLNVTLEMLYALSRLPTDQGMSQKQLGRVLKKEKATTSALIDQLEKLDLVSRHKTALDRRVTYVSLTAYGQQVVSSFEVVVAGLYRVISFHLDESELQVSIGVCQQMIANLQELRAK